jgi:hypothetical protein
MILSGRYFVFLFRQGTEQSHQGNMNTRRVAIFNTTKEARYQIWLDPVFTTVFLWMWRRLRWAVILSCGRGATAG